MKLMKPHFPCLTRNEVEVSLFIMPSLIWILWCLISLDHVPPPYIPGDVFSEEPLFVIICNFVGYKRCKQLFVEIFYLNQNMEW